MLNQCPICNHVKYLSGLELCYIFCLKSNPYDENCNHFSRKSFLSRFIGWLYDVRYRLNVKWHGFWDNRNMKVQS